MAVNSFISNFKRLPTGFLGALAIIIGIHWTVTSSETFWRTVNLYAAVGKDDAIRLEAALRVIEADDAKNKVLLIGSSQTREGFDVSYLNDRFAADGLTFYNLGIAGSSQPIDVFMLKDRLYAIEPKIIMYMPFVESFYSDYSENDFNKMQYHFSFSILPRLADHFGWRYLIEQQRPLVDAVIGKASILYRFRDQLNRVSERLTDAAMSGKWLQEPQVYEYSENKPQAYFEEVIRQAQGYRYKGSRYTKLNQELFKEFADETARQGIKLIVFDAPVHPRMDVLVRPETQQEYVAYLKQTAGEVGFSFMSLDELPTFEPADFIDFAHLNSHGRQKLSSFMEHYMREVVAANKSTTLQPSVRR